MYTYIVCVYMQIYISRGVDTFLVGVTSQDVNHSQHTCMCLSCYKRCRYKRCMERVDCVGRGQERQVNGCIDSLQEMYAERQQPVYLEATTHVIQATVDLEDTGYDTQPLSRQATVQPISHISHDIGYCGPRGQRLRHIASKQTGYCLAYITYIT